MRGGGQEGVRGPEGLLQRFPQGPPAHLGPGRLESRCCCLVSGGFFQERSWSLGSRPCEGGDESE